MSASSSGGVGEEGGVGGSGVEGWAGLGGVGARDDGGLGSWSEAGAG